MPAHGRITECWYRPVIPSTNAFGDFSKCTILSETVDNLQLVERCSSSQRYGGYSSTSRRRRCLPSAAPRHAMHQAVRAVRQHDCHVRIGCRVQKLSNPSALGHFLRLDETVLHVLLSRASSLDERQWSTENNQSDRFRFSLWSLDLFYTESRPAPKMTSGQHQ